ncbi:MULTISPECIES: DUF6470 family protein [Brevibacillus]|uniref:DUF6470 family protein n=1 Tax=Brevibacillus TaxID=55080 RepID=UPI000F09E4C0|nr:MULTISPECIES: DUF6470 family protein [Brevibacillus]MDR7317982.1 hypothetical protein [Brevibacillus nitrificans]MEC2130557.1 DUF6470 family protein [Brevibacillus centrosporus]RNB68841.1 hypothetical protein EDM55_15620 [Brevibacillus centrosporus]GED33879.1 hypothetical protein BCE02nite_50200 [Brevibacillus centrosporus]
MRIPQIRISQGFTQIDMNIQEPKVDIEQQPADISIKQKPPEITVERIRGSLNVDTTEARANLDLKSAARRISEFADYASEQLTEYIVAKSQEGDQLMKIGNKQTSIANQINNRRLETKEPYKLPYNPDYMNIRFTPDKLNIEWNISKPEVTVTPHKPEINLIRGQVETYIKQKNWINVEVNRYDTEV